MKENSTHNTPVVNGRTLKYRSNSNSHHGMMRSQGGKRMKRMYLIVLVAILSMLSTQAIQPASAATLLSAKEQQMKLFLKSEMPTLSNSELNALVKDKAFVAAASKVVRIEISHVPKTSSVTTRAAAGCTNDWTRVKGRGLFGTLWSHTLHTTGCWDGKNIVTSASITKTVPDVTTYGSTFGWSYRGEWQPRNKHWYTWNGHYKGGYINAIFGEFARCLGGNIGCIDQRFTNLDVRYHYDGSTAYRNEVN